MRADFGVEYLCGKFKVSVSGYYAWANRPVSAARERRWELAAKVLQIFVDSGRAVGYRKITVELAASGIHVDGKTVLSVMQDLGIMSPAARAAFKKAAARAGTRPDPDDLLERRFDVVEPGTVLVGDITYVPTSEGWLYVATVIDLASRMVLGWASGKRQNTTLIITALRRAIATGHVRPKAIFHSDHGSQYRSKRYAKYCGRHGIRRSMGKNFECWDNAVAESFFSKLKSEKLRWIRFTTRAHATREVAAYMRYFNTKRRHQTLGYATPAETLARLTNQTHTPTPLQAAA